MKGTLHVPIVSQVSLPDNEIRLIDARGKVLAVIVGVEKPKPGPTSELLALAKQTLAWPRYGKSGTQRLLEGESIDVVYPKRSR